MRRMWMLLLVVALMVIALAVPAMAAETDHGDHTDWTPISNGLTCMIILRSLRSITVLTSPAVRPALRTVRRSPPHPVGEGH